MAPRRQTFRMRRHGQKQNRSMLLEDYISNRYPNLQLADIVSHAVEFAQDRIGSTFIQRKLDDVSDHRKETLFNEIQPVLLELMMHPYGNYVIQKFFDVGKTEHRHEMYLKVQENVEDLSLNKYGCRVVQKAVEKGTILQKFFVLQPFVGDCINRVAKDPNGNHVLQKSFHCGPVSIQDFLFNQLQPYSAGLCSDLYGCRVIQCILQCGTVDHRTIIFEDIFKIAYYLMLDRYGNYVIQHVLDFCAPADKNRMIQFILNHVITMSVQKYASNVVEKCLGIATKQQQEATMNLICVQDGFWLKKFCTETYANYVVQKLIATATIDQVRELREKISPYINEIERYVCGRKIISKLDERLYDHEMPVAFQSLRFLDD